LEVAASFVRVVEVDGAGGFFGYFFSLWCSLVFHYSQVNKRGKYLLNYPVHAPTTSLSVIVFIVTEGCEIRMFFTIDARAEVLA